ncbi:MAG: hypothetical protein ABSH19_06585 [Opitutales bacterium]|jgi:hypothetical protein
MTLAWLAPLFVLFEIAQLLVATRYIGIEQIRKGVHPLEEHPRGPALLSAVWVAGIVANYLYQIALLCQPRETGLPALLMIGVSLGGFGLRRMLGLKYALVVLTFEGAMRAGFLAYVFIAVVIHPSWHGWPGPTLMGR